MILGVHAISRIVGAGALLAALVPLGACTLGPRYRPPALADGAEAPLVSLTPTAETNAQPPDDWWRLYHDALLDQLLQEAFTANTDLKVAEANLSAARAVLEQAKARRYPQTAIEAGGIYAAILRPTRSSSSVATAPRIPGSSIRSWMFPTR